jgi:transcriptional regulator with XRE-family HTH domain
MTSENTELVPPAGAGKPETPPNRIKEWRNRRRMSLAELGEIVGLSRSEISKLENGARRVRADHMTALAKALRIKPEDLIGGEAARAFAGDPAEPPPAVAALPVLLAREGEDGLLIFGEEPCDQTPRPPQLAMVAAAYAVLMPSTSMEPRVPVGAMLYVHPFQPARPGDLAVVHLRSDGRRIVAVERGPHGLVGLGGDNSPSLSLGDRSVTSVERVVGLWFA